MDLTCMKSGSSAVCLLAGRAVKMSSWLVDWGKVVWSGLVCWSDRLTLVWSGGPTDWSWSGLAVSMWGEWSAQRSGMIWFGLVSRSRFINDLIGRWLRKLFWTVHVHVCLKIARTKQISVEAVRNWNFKYNYLKYNNIILIMIVITIITGKFQITRYVSVKGWTYVGNPFFNMHSLRTVLLRC